ncbi:MAG: hypothetical protein ABIQ18_09480, partial [Umezawaea sp.]
MSITAVDLGSPVAYMHVVTRLPRSVPSGIVTDRDKSGGQLSGAPHEPIAPSPAPRRSGLTRPVQKRCKEFTRSAAHRGSGTDQPTKGSGTHALVKRFEHCSGRGGRGNGRV